MNILLIHKLTLVITDLAGLILCYYFYCGFLEQKYHKKINMMLFSIGIITFLISTNLIIKEPIIFVIIAIFVYTAMALFCFEGYYLIRLISGVFFVTFNVVLEAITAFFLSFVFKTSLAESLTSTILYVTGAFVSKLMILIVIKVILRFIKNKSNTISIRNWGLMLFIPTISIFLTIYISYQSILLKTINLYSILSMFGLLYINLISFGLFEGIIRKLEENNNFRFANQQLILQQDHYKKIIEGYSTTRGLWHDMRNSLIAIYTCIEKNEYESAMKNIKNIQNDLINAMQDFITGNTVIDAIIGNKKMDAKELGINIKTNIVVPEQLEINQMDLCTILGNALDNAIEACKRINNIELTKQIEIIMKCKEDYLVLSVINPAEIKTIKVKNGRYISNKENTNNEVHGYGIYNIERAVKKNHGSLKINVQNNQFILYVVLPLKD